jgi:hypothetical protein
MTRDEYNQSRKDRAERNKRMVARFPLGPYFMDEYIDMNLPIDEYKKEVKRIKRNE